MYLVLVSRCSHVSMLRFLIRLSTKGLADRCLPFVRVIPITALRLRWATGTGRGWDVGGGGAGWGEDVRAGRGGEGSSGGWLNGMGGHSRHSAEAEARNRASRGLGCEWWWG